MQLTSTNGICEESAKQTNANLTQQLFQEGDSSPRCMMELVKEAWESEQESLDLKFVVSSALDLICRRSDISIETKQKRPQELIGLKPSDVSGRNYLEENLGEEENNKGISFFSEEYDESVEEVDKLHSMTPQSRYE